MFDQDTVNAFTGPLASALCVYGAVLASRHKLKRWIAVSQLLPPTPEAATTDESSAPASPAVTGWRRFFTKHALKQYAFFSLYMGTQFFIIFGLGRLSSRLVLNAFWLVFMSIFTTICIGTATVVLVPDAQKVIYERTSPTSGLNIKTEAVNPTPPSSIDWRNHARTAVAVSIAILNILASYNGYVIVQSIISACCATMLVAGLGVPRWSTKAVVKVLLCFEIGTPVLTAIIIFGMSIFTNVDMDTPPNHPSRGVASPSDWVVAMLAFPIRAQPVIAPGILLALTHRYEYSAHHSALRLRSAQPVHIPATLPSFAAPVTRAGFTALTFTLASYWLLRTQYSAWQESSSEVFVMFATIPIVMAALAGSAWKHGVFKEWWQYRETWLPDKSEAAAMIMDHVEQAPDEKGSDEDKVEAGL